MTVHMVGGCVCVCAMLLDLFGNQELRIGDAGCWGWGLSFKL